MLNSPWRDFPYWIRNQPGYHDLRSWQVNGWRTARDRLFLLPRIRRAAPIRTPPVTRDCPVSIHVVCYRGDWLFALWMLHSLYRVLPSPLPLVLHLQTSLAPGKLETTRRLYPDARIIEATESDERVGEFLMSRRLARCLEWRHRLGVMQKLIDVLIVEGGRRRIGLDPDIIFFREPTELLAAAFREDGQWFQHDAFDAYTLTREEAALHVPAELPPRVNTGLTVRSPGSVDFEFVESLLAIPQVARRIFQLEQTLAAFAAQARQEVRYLPAEYYIDMNGRPDLEKIVCRHYAGPSKRFLAPEGIRPTARRLGL